MGCVFIILANVGHSLRIENVQTPLQLFRRHLLPMNQLLQNPSQLFRWTGRRHPQKFLSTTNTKAALTRTSTCIKCTTNWIHQNVVKMGRNYFVFVDGSLLQSITFKCTSSTSPMNPDSFVKLVVSATTEPIC